MNRLLILAAAAALTACPTTEPGPSDGRPEDLDAIVSEDRPSKRSEVQAVANEASNEILLFGGNDGPIVNQIPAAAYRGDTWIFSPGYGWTEIDGSGPSARGRYGAALDATNGRALLFGGRWRETGTSGDYDLYNDLWAYDFAESTWSEIDTSGGPAPRFYPSVVWSPEDEALYVYGGLLNEDPLFFEIADDLWKWTEADGWEEIATSGDAPSSRSFTGTTIDPTRNRMVLFAGQLGDFQSLAYNDTFALDLRSGEWTELENGGDNAPFTRMHPHILYDDARDRIVLFGGHTDIGDDNDLWEMAAEGGTWRLIGEGDRFTGVGFGCLGNSSEVPADYVEQDLDYPERRHKAFIAPMWDNLWVFGGMHSECSDHLDDTWRYDLATQEWSELIEARTGESCVRRNDDCECLCI